MCAVTFLVLNYLWSFLAVLYPNYFSLFCRRPGILVLINEADWELMGELDYKLQDQDNVLFISTLHGG